MKKFLKKLLLCFLIIPTMFMFGCEDAPSTPGGSQNGGQQSGGQESGGQESGSQQGGSQSGGQESGGSQGGEQNGGSQTGGEQTGGEQTGGEQTGGSTVDPEEEARVAAYAIIHNFAKSGIYNLSDSYELEYETSSVFGGRYDLSEINLTKEEWDTCSNGIFNKYEEGKSSPYKTISGINSNYQGYKFINYTDEEGEHTYLEETVQEYEDKLAVFKRGYTYASYVGEDYVGNAFVYDLYDSYKTATILSIIANTEDYTELAEKVLPVAESVNDGFGDENLVPTDATTNVTIKTLENSQYELNICAEYNSKYIPVYGSKKVVVFVEYDIKFTENNIVSINVKNGQYENSFEWSARDVREYLGSRLSNPSVDIPSGSKVYLVVDNYTEVNLAFGEYDEDKMPTDLSEFNTGYMMNNMWQPRMHYVGANGEIQDTKYPFVTWGNDLSSYVELEEGTYELYLDLDKTRPIAEDSKVPSYYIADIYIFPKAN